MTDKELEASPVPYDDKFSKLEFPPDPMNELNLTSGEIAELKEICRE